MPPKVLYDVPHYLQDPKSMICGPVCLYMIYEHFQHPQKNFDDFINSFAYVPGGTYSPQIGTDAVKHKFETEIVFFNPRLTTPKDIGTTHIADWLERAGTISTDGAFVDTISYFREFSEAGGKVVIDIPSARHIDRKLDEGWLCICMMTTYFLEDRANALNSHFVVICGYDDEFYYVRDPLSREQNELRKWPKDQVIYGVHVNSHRDPDNGALIFIKPKQ